MRAAAAGAGLLAVVGLAGQGVAGPIVPTDGMVITTDVTFTAGVHVLPNGVSVGASGVTVDLGGSTLVGAGSGYGVTSVGFDDVTIRNGAVQGYYYGMRIESGAGIQVLDCDLSGNWVDPNSLAAPAPFLDINVGPNLGDLTNLGGGLFMNAVTGATISGNLLMNQENGMDLYFVADSLVEGNDASHNTGWGIHLHGSTGNTICGNVCDHCTRPGLGDSAGMLLVVGSHGNEILDCSFRESGDGFFIGNEHGCPSNDNLVQGCDGSFAGANAFEATFSSGNQFIDNVADGSNYGFWLGYSHSGNVICNNSIRANNANGIEIEHGQGNVIEGNQIIGNGGKGIVLRTDGLVHFPPATFPCLDLPDQAASRDYTIHDNVVQSNFGLGLELVATTDSLIANNLLAANLGGTAVASGAGNAWSTAPIPGTNIVGGPTLGGNYWDDYAGADTDADGLGDTMVPYTNGGQIPAPGDPHPLIGDPDVEDFDNPPALCDRAWSDLGRNTRQDGQVFDTANGAHFATDGVDLYLLEGTNGTRLSYFDPATARYEPRASVPEAVWDGGGFQHGAGPIYFATVGVQFNPADGSGKGAKLYAYDAGADAWSPRAPSQVSGVPVANEALAFDPVNGRLYASVVAVGTGGPASLRRRLAIYDPGADAWIGATPANAVDFAAGSELEYLDGRIYAWPGGFAGGAVNGGDSLLYVYDIVGGAWSVTPTVQGSGVVPGFRSGAIDIWGVALTSDAANGLVLVLGGEANRQVYVHDVAAATWAVAPLAVYDGGWGDALEFVAGRHALYQVDGRNALGTPQGTAVLLPHLADTDADGVVDVEDLVAVIVAWGPCPPPCGADTNGDGAVDVTDLVNVIVEWGDYRCPR